MKKTAYLKPAIVAVTMNGRQSILAASPSGTNISDLPVETEPTTEEGRARKSDYVNWDDEEE